MHNSSEMALDLKKKKYIYIYIYYNWKGSVFYRRVSYCELWLISPWIALLWITVDCEYFHYRLYCLDLLSAGLFQNAWEWTQTYCIVDDIVAIDCIHCG
jgi:hypothetical protein